MYKWHKLWITMYKKTKFPTASSKKTESKSNLVGAKTGYCTSALHSVPPKGKPSKPTLQPHCWTHLPSHHMRNQIVPPTSGSRRAKQLLVLSHPCCSRGSNKILSEFLIWPLINCYRFRRPRALGGSSFSGLQQFQKQQPSIKFFTTPRLCKV